MKEENKKEMECRKLRRKKMKERKKGSNMERKEQKYEVSQKWTKK